MIKKDLLLYLVTDREIAGEKLEKIVETAIKNGVTMVQLREKHMLYEQFCDKARVMKQICDRYNVPLIINDNIDVCLAVNANGVHLGSADCDIEIARKLLGADKIIGASARDVVTAKLAEQKGADYLGVGAIFGTTTKSDAKSITKERLAEITNCVHIPVVAIGGITADNLAGLKGCGIAGVAVVSAILKSQDVEKTTQKFIEKLDLIVQ